MLRLHGHGRFANAFRCLETLKFVIQDSRLNSPADPLVAGLSPPRIDQLKDRVAAGEAKFEGLVQCIPLLAHCEQIDCQKVTCR